MKLLFATRSAHKLEEVQRILRGTPAEVLSLGQAGIAPDPAEEGLEPFETFEENALSKADYFHRISGLPTVADDSGLEVDALDGAPGVRSKRFAPAGGRTGSERDRANNAFLLERLTGLPPAERSARFVCVAALVTDAGRELFRGEAPGRIVEGERGVRGFGYDPLFFDPELGRTFAEISAEEKNARSHRGKAFRSLAAYLASPADPDPGGRRAGP